MLIKSDYFYKKQNTYGKKKIPKNIKSTVNVDKFMAFIYISLDVSTALDFSRVTARICNSNAIVALILYSILIVVQLLRQVDNSD